MRRKLGFLIIGVAAVLEDFGRFVGGFPPLGEQNGQPAITRSRTARVGDRL